MMNLTPNTHDTKKKKESPEILDMILAHPNVLGRIGGFSIGDSYKSQHSTVSISVPFINQPPKIYSNKPDRTDG